MSGVSRFERWWLGSWPHRLHIRRYVPHLLKSCPEPFRGEVLEVGSGSGWTSRRILETFPQVELTATDVDPQGQQFERMKSRYGQRLRFEQADLLSLPFDRSSFDFVLAIHVLNKVDDHNEAVRQFLRVLRPGGLIGLSGDRPKLTRLQEILKEEEVEIVYEHGSAHYYLWARKPHPYAPT